jgi:cobalt-zinc-cadmium efflux system outer membrane protein
LMASQAVPPSSMRRQMREAQAAEAAMLRAELEDARNDLVRRVKRAYIEVQFRDEAVEIAGRNRDLAEDMLRTAEALYATGKAMQQHVFEAQVRLSQMVDTLVMHRREREGVVARLNGLLYRAPGAPLPRLPALAKGSEMVDAGGLRALAEEGNAGLEAMRRGVVHAERMAGATAAGERPHVVYSFAYMIRQPMGEMGEGGTDMWSASVELSLPWVRRSGKLDREVEAAEARRAAAEREVEAMRNELGAMVEEHATDVRRADEQLALLETGLMPQAEGAYAAARASYATGMGELAELLDNQMNLYNLELQRAMLLAERRRLVAELEYVVGGPLTASPAAEPEVETGVE